MVAKQPETDYTKLKNRCPNCGHRLSQVENKKCTVIMGDGRPDHDQECPCRKHYRP